MLFNDTKRVEDNDAIYMFDTIFTQFRWSPVLVLTISDSLYGAALAQYLHHLGDAGSLVQAAQDAAHRLHKFLVL